MFRYTYSSLCLSVLLINIICTYTSEANIIKFISSENHDNDTNFSENISSMKVNNTNLGGLIKQEFPEILLHPKTLKNRKMLKRVCPEKERPISIGTYEIPTQRDLVMFTSRMITRSFNKYHEKTLLLLKDIKEATKATVAVETKCLGKKDVYRSCVKKVGKEFIVFTKELVKALELKKHEMANLTEGKICDLASMKTNPLDLIKVLAVDEVTIDFTLPAFLRSLGKCSANCDKSNLTKITSRPIRHMTDQDLIVTHLLTSKTYAQIIKNSYT